MTAVLTSLSWSLRIVHTHQNTTVQPREAYGQDLTIKNHVNAYLTLEIITAYVVLVYFYLVIFGQGLAMSPLLTSNWQQSSCLSLGACHPN